jgi:uncharacterized protein
MSLIIDIKVKPGSSRSCIALDKAGLLVAYVKSQAQEGKANRELIKLLAQSLAVPQADITIIAGITGRKKKISINQSLTLGQVMCRLGLEVPATYC